MAPENLNYLECLSTNPCLCQNYLLWWKGWILKFVIGKLCLAFDILELILWHGNVYCEENDILFLAVS